MEATGRNPFSPLSCTQTCMLGLALSQAGTEFVLAQDYGLKELAHPLSWSHAESAGGSSQMDVHKQWFWAKQLLCNFTSAFFILRYKHNGVACAEKHGLNITREVRNPAENILKVYMDGGNTWLQEKTEALCAVPHLRSKPTTLDIWLLRGLCGSAHAALSGLFQSTSGTSATSWPDTAQSPPGMPRCLEHIPVQCELGVKPIYVFCPVFGVSGGNETCFQPQFLQVIAVLDLFSFLFTYYRGKKEHCMHTHIFMLL